MKKKHVTGKRVRREAAPAQVLLPPAAASYPEEPPVQADLFPARQSAT